MRWTGACLIEVHLHSKSFGGDSEMAAKGGSGLIEVAATAGLTILWLVKRAVSVRPKFRS